MKKIASLLLVLVMLLSALTACGKKEETPAAPTRIAGMTGPTSIGMVKMIADTKESTAEGSYEFTIAGTADEITPKLIKNELDIAAVPANVAAKLYHKTEGGIKLIAAEILGKMKPLPTFWKPA